MAYRKQLKDKDGNVIYPDVGVITLDTQQKMISSSYNFSSGGSYTNWTSLTVAKTGKYLVFTEGRVSFTNNGYAYYAVGFAVNGSQVWARGVTISPEDSQHAHRDDITSMLILDLSANDVLSPQIRVDTGTGCQVVSGASVNIVRIG